jgi:hypothetical protein
MGCRLRNTSWAAAFFPFFFLGRSTEANKNIQHGSVSKSAAHTVKAGSSHSSVQPGLYL